MVKIKRVRNSDNEVFHWEKISQEISCQTEKGEPYVLDGNTIFCMNLKFS